ncbi:MAG: gidB [Alphaproteobacteria bacterium]|nr:gidB [Alphaproteobacteria bacterium]
MPDIFKNTFERHGFFVSRETLDKFETYNTLLRKWQKAINLVGPTTVDDAPERHFFDSAQMFRYIPHIEVTLVDLGSGAGFPGLVLAMLGVKDVHLVESDIRKATFLREVSRETSTPVTIHDKRIEDTVIPNIDVVTARALAPLQDLLAHIDRLRTPNHAIYGVLAKGLQHGEEIDKARKDWDFALEVFPSESDMSGKILRIKDLVQK